VAILHPLLYLLRRIIFALVVIFLGRTTLFQQLIFIWTNVIMLAFAVNDFPWKESLINQQHIVNEMFVYVVSIMLLLFTDYVPFEVRYNLGYVMIFVLLSFVFYNLLVAVIVIGKTIYLVVLRYRNLGWFLLFQEWYYALN
jgi:hypothetical protein